MYVIIIGKNLILFTHKVWEWFQIEKELLKRVIRLTRCQKIYIFAPALRETHENIDIVNDSNTRLRIYLFILLFNYKALWTTCRFFGMVDTPFFQNQKQKTWRRKTKKHRAKSHSLSQSFHHWGKLPEPSKESA